ncbi:hypothetical protein [Paraburkholderia oxyphila]|uniref:hypothetical protein n=1 Tax=Paraburkholderia oxyphila TaxID=614212 RepID=UPI000487D15B|nr:hypothetical protein [Paraburkholderia oxyphila]
MLRRFVPQCDSWERLTQRRHRAYARLAPLGLHCASADQAASATRSRALAGDCFVADTPFPAAHLLAFYRAAGFCLVDVVRFAGRGYDSAVFSKAAASQPLAGVRHVPALLREAGICFAR